MKPSKFKVLVKPFENYFFNLPNWNGIDYIARLSEYIKVPKTNKGAFLIQFKKMLVRTVAGSLDINYANIWAFILVHQDTENETSSFLKWLCPDSLSHLYAEKDELDKRGSITFTDNFIINLKELSSYYQADIDQIDIHRLVHYVYLKLPSEDVCTDFKKVANIIGSATNIDFLKDYEENIGWICFKIKNINPDYKKDNDIDKLWSQAYYLFKNGFDYKPNEIEMKGIEVVNNLLLKGDEDNGYCRYHTKSGIFKVFIN